MWRVAIYNPMRMYQVGYNLTALKIAHCLNECSGHGQCDDTGTCLCDANWAGGDCSVNKDGDCQVAALPPATASACMRLHSLVPLKCTRAQSQQCIIVGVSGMHLQPGNGCIPSEFGTPQ